MIDYHRLGIMPEKNHIWMRSETGHLYQEHCLTRAGFDKSYSILYHMHPPTVELATATSPLDGSDFVPQFAPNGELDFPRLGRILKEGCPEATFIPEIWQGHKNEGEGFWIALERLEGQL